MTETKRSDHLRRDQKRLLGTILLAVVLVGLAAFFVWWRNKPPGYLDPLIPPANTAGTIVALKENGGRQTLVAIAPDGSQKSPEGEANDIECSWDAKGERVVFISNRTPDGSYQVFNWVPDRENEPYRISEGAPVRGLFVHPSGRYVLVASRGDIVAFSYPGGLPRRIMPPSVEPFVGGLEEVGLPGAEQDYEDVAQAISSFWRQIKDTVDGEAFERGFLDATGRYFAGVLTTGRGKAVVLQDLEPEDPHQVGARVPFAAETLEITMHPKEPRVLVSLRRFQYPSRTSIPREMLNPDGTARKPFENAMLMLDFNGGMVPVAVSPDDSQQYLHPVLSPGGTEVAFILTVRDGDGYATRGLFVAPAEEGGVSRARLLVEGDARQPSWLPDSSGLLFVRGGDIYRVNVDGTGLKPITTDGGPYSSPHMSPR